MQDDSGVRETAIYTNVVNAHHFKLAALIKNDALCALFSVRPPPQICILRVLQQDIECARPGINWTIKPCTEGALALRPKQGDYIPIHQGSDSVSCSVSIAVLNTASLKPPPSSQTVHRQINIIKFQISSSGSLLLLGEVGGGGGRRGTHVSSWPQLSSCFPGKGVRGP